MLAWEIQKLVGPQHLKIKVAVRVRSMSSIFCNPCTTQAREQSAFQLCAKVSDERSKGETVLSVVSDQEAVSERSPPWPMPSVITGPRSTPVMKPISGPRSHCCRTQSGSALRPKV
ncbi:hypothetical protein VNO78_11546 [Psophocarpus tetragonolobus]|uniref:Uncharacterized protein n=1 Tax=Psophocarpus tetragonolobus TaxID=3891 RepID=A0AAN9SLM7_PSOTE